MFDLCLPACMCPGQLNLNGEQARAPRPRFQPCAAHHLFPSRFEKPWCTACTCALSFCSEACTPLVSVMQGPCRSRLPHARLALPRAQVFSQIVIDRAGLNREEDKSKDVLGAQQKSRNAVDYSCCNEDGVLALPLNQVPVSPVPPAVAPVSCLHSNHVLVAAQHVDSDAADGCRNWMNSSSEMCSDTHATSRNCMTSLCRCLSVRCALHTISNALSYNDPAPGV